VESQHELCIRQLSGPLCDLEMRAGLDLLLAAHESARHYGSHRLEFALEVEEIRNTGITDRLLRWLVCQGLAECSAPQSRRETSYDSHSPLDLSAGCRLMLSELGARLARALCTPQDSENRQYEPATRRGAYALVQTPIPNWIEHDRELWVGRHLVKWFRQVAQDQERVLNRFQAMRWCPRIVAPLVRQLQRDPHVHATIRNLNRAQYWPFVCFGGDGTGRGIFYRVVLTLPATGRDACLGPCYARFF
jgi:hypothetical protein